MHKALLFCAAIAALLAAGCGASSEGDGSGTKTVVTVIERVVEQPAPEPTAASSKPEAEREPKPAAAASESQAAEIEVPDVVGENHQYAQDTMQAAGLYMLDERDATGRGRMLVWDRNWVVVEQDPPAGTMVTEDTTITLSSKKEGE